MATTPLRADRPPDTAPPEAPAAWLDAPLDVGPDVIIELREQRHDTLRNFALLQALAGLLWLVYV